MKKMSTRAAKPKREASKSKVRIIEDLIDKLTEKSLHHDLAHISTDLFEFSSLLQDSISSPKMRNIILTMVDKQEEIEKETTNIRLEATSTRVSGIEEEIQNLRREVGFMRRQFLLGRSEINEMRNDLNYFNKRISKLENTYTQSVEELAEGLKHVLVKIDGFKLFYIQEKHQKVLITVFYEKDIEDFSEVEINIFNAYEEVSYKFSEIETEILVLLYPESFAIPNNVLFVVNKNEP